MVQNEKSIPFCSVFSTSSSATCSGPLFRQVITVEKTAVPTAYSLTGRSWWRDIVIQLSIHKLLSLLTSS